MNSLHLRLTVSYFIFIHVFDVSFKCPLTVLNRDFKTQRRDGDKNVAEKVNLRYFSLYSDYSYPLTLSIVGEPS